MGVGREAPAVDVDYVLAGATHQHSEDVSVRTSGVVVATHQFALAETAREMVLLLSRAGMGRKVVLSASAANGKLAIEAEATDETPAVTAGRIRKEIDGVLLTLQRLSGATVSPLKNGRGVRAVLPYREKPTRPLVLLLTQDQGLAKLVERNSPSQSLEVRWWPMSIPLLVTLQEATSSEQVALCIIDARARDDFLPRLYTAVAREHLRDRVVMVGVDETYPVPEELAEFARVVSRRDLAGTLATLGQQAFGREALRTLAGLHFRLERPGSAARREPRAAPEATSGPSATLNAAQHHLRRAVRTQRCAAGLAPHLGGELFTINQCDLAATGKRACILGVGAGTDHKATGRPAGSHDAVELANGFDTDAPRAPLLALHEVTVVAALQLHVDAAVGATATRLVHCEPLAAKVLGHQPLEVLPSHLKQWIRLGTGGYTLVQLPSMTATQHTDQRAGDEQYRHDVLRCAGDSPNQRANRKAGWARGSRQRQVCHEL